MLKTISSIFHASSVLSAIIAASFLGSCSSHDNPAMYRDRTASSVDLEQYLGRWYVIANIPNWFEKGAHNSTETYSYDKETEKLSVDFQYLADSFTGKEKHLPQKAYVYDKQTNAHWKIILYKFFKFDYLILEIAKDYSYTVVGVPDRKLLWVMSRKPKMAPDLYQSILARMRSKGENVDQLKLVPQEER
jgi:apolipoprotein D and lipocalin family protein